MLLESPTIPLMHPLDTRSPAQYLTMWKLENKQISSKSVNVKIYISTKIFHFYNGK